MFALKLRQVYKVCDKIIIRSLRSRRIDINEHYRANPGIDSRLKSFREEGIIVRDDNIGEIIDQESDFSNVGEVYNEHLNETLIGKYKLRHHIVKEKYFKENMPNLLTWSEKEQIRYLANTYPDEWTAARLAESFPVTEPVVKKLLKFPWKPATEQRIARHDASAMRNWRELKEGSLNIPNEIRDHFLKFSNRQIPPLRKSSIKVDLSQEKIGEFERIVRNCADKAEKTKQSDSKTDKLESKNNQSNKQVSHKGDTKIVTLEQLTTKIKHRLATGTNVDISDKIILDSISNKPEKVEVNDEMAKEIQLQSAAETSVAPYQKEDKQVIKPIDYPERIRVPKKAYQRGATYKINDCYYDHDGRFLYRVIGLGK